MEKSATLYNHTQSHDEATMPATFDLSECIRCGGLLVVDHCFDVLGNTGDIDCQVFRCVQCGDLVDPVILRNRTNPPAPSPKKHVKWSSLKLAAIGFR